MKLTAENYFTDANKYLSNSKISAFLRDKHYFKQLCIDGSIDFKQTPSIKFGKGIDIVLTDSVKAFNKEYQIKVLKKNNPALFEEQKSLPKERTVTPEFVDNVLGAVKAVKGQDAYKEIIDRGFVSQEIFYETRDDMGIWEGLCGIPDWYLYDDTTYGNPGVIIIDLKTTQSVDPKKFLYSCMDYGYFRQQAMYQRLIKNKFPKAKWFESRILAVENSGLYKVELFKINQQIIEANKKELDIIIKSIVDEKEFAPQNLSWDDAIEIN